MTARRNPQRGVALIEALVALAVMAIGMLGLVGVQSVLRGNSDLSKQRSEAVRLAQEGIEQWRAFAVLETDASTAYTDYTDIITGATTTHAGANASYSRTRTVTNLLAPQSGKAVQVDVTWIDRTNAVQTVHLATVIAGIAPELAATLTVPADGTPVRQPLGRSRGIPLLAKDLGNGTSGLKPPGAPSTVVWRFDNITGLITICSTSTAATTNDLTTANISCTTNTAQLLAGFLRYALATAAPNALAPLDMPPATPPTASVDRTLPAPPLTEACFVQTTTYTTYYCAVPVAVISSSLQPWSGRLAFSGAIATSAAENSPSQIRICRYFELTDDAATPSVDEGDGNYTSVTTPLINQNYLAISAGDGSSVYACPSGTTALHQPV
jgi:Tfp pilus assembly protein PilV